MSTEHRFLLLQARRPEDRVRDEERDAFAQRLGVAESQVLQIDIFGSDLDLARLQDVDALLVGGAGEFSVLDDTDGVRACIDFLTLAAERGFPIFASCFGFQALVVGLGGEVVQDLRVGSQAASGKSRGLRRSFHGCGGALETQRDGSDG